jgi:hypothetical protein
MKSAAFADDQAYGKRTAFDHQADVMFVRG